MKGWNCINVWAISAEWQVPSAIWVLSLYRNTISPAEHYEQIISGVRHQLGDGALSAAWAEGQGLALESAIAYALEQAE